MDKEKVYYDEEGNFLKCNWDESIEKDLKELHDIDLQQEMDEVMEYQLKEEKVREILDNVLIQNVKEIIQGENQLENFIYYVVFFNVEGENLMIHHLVGYEEYPSQESINHNIEELRNDPDFKKPSEIMDNLKYRVIKIK